MNTSGIVRAIVTDNQDPEKLGRVKLRYPWLGSRSGQAPTEWARHGRPISHSGCGDWALPDVGDEVLVGFEFGERDRPIVIGSLYNTDAKPPLSGRDGDANENGLNNLRMIKTRSGHLLMFDDLEGHRAIHLRDGDGNSFEINTDEKVIALKDKSGNEVSMTPAGISAKDCFGNALSLAECGITAKDARGNELTTSSGQISIKCQGDLKLESSGKVSIDGAASIALGSGASEALLKGTSFLALFNAHIHPTPDGPSGPPQVPLTPAVLSTKVKTQ